MSRSSGDESFGFTVSQASTGFRSSPLVRCQLTPAEATHSNPGLRAFTRKWVSHGPKKQNVHPRRGPGYFSRYPRADPFRQGVSSAQLDLRLSESARVTQRKLDRSPRSGRYPLCRRCEFIRARRPLPVSPHPVIHLLLLFPRSSLPCPPADLFVSYFAALRHTAVHRAHLFPRYANHRDVFVTTPWPRVDKPRGGGVCMSVCESACVCAKGKERQCERERRGKKERQRRGRDEETMYRLAVRNHNGVRIAGASATSFHRRSVSGRAKSAHASSRPGRGADGCRATAVGGAFGRAYFPAPAAPRRHLVASTASVGGDDDVASRPGRPP